MSVFKDSMCVYEGIGFAYGFAGFWDPDFGLTVMILLKKIKKVLYNKKIHYL